MRYQYISPWSPSGHAPRPLEVDGCSTLLLVSTELEVLAALEDDLVLGLARGALETKDDLLGLLGKEAQTK